MIKRVSPFIFVLATFGCAQLPSQTARTAHPGAAVSRAAMVPASVLTVDPRDTVPPRDTFTVQSRALNERRPINVYAPPAYRAPGAGVRRLPVLYMPDGALDEDFPHVAHTVDSLIARGAIRPVLVVGIPNTERRRDLTGPTRVHSDSAIAAHVGGSAAFRRFLRDELMPEIERRYATTPERGIVGESLAGLFVMETFLDEPALFTHYIAFDPSVWWNSGAIADSANIRIAAMQAAPHTLYVGTSKEPSTAVGSARIIDLLRATRLRGLGFLYVPRTDLGHDNIFRTLLPAALVNALR